ncbi:DNA-binding XRE family transcriptional regulator [Paraburkholderia sp. GAS333]|uniref:helix-turn-helix domain-containing protein n=1 Tax=Paraburkholderia sp. GAS333 TaxID=3156279 RepID=UPI003D1DA3ED
MLRAWRLYRELSPIEAAELAGVSPDTILWHERGYNVPNAGTLKRFADIYDCTVGKLTPKPGSETTPVQSIRPHKDRAMEYSPDDTRYPDAVMAHLTEGKSPIAAWRRHRHMAIKQCAKAFGCAPKTFKEMEALPVLRDRTRKSLAMVLACNPTQLLRPKKMVVEPVSFHAEPAPSGHCP